jgi:integrase
MVAVPASSTGTKRVRRYFKEREAALAYIITLKQQGFLGAEGQSSSSSKVTLGECAALWIARHQQARLGYSQIKIVLNRLADRLGKDPIESVDHRKLDAFFRSLENFSAVYQHNHFRITRRFFSFCQDFLEVIPRNPMRKLQEPRLEHVDPAILTPEQMRACLDVARGDIRLTSYLALGGFAGLRTEEILRQSWSDIDWANGEIYVRQPKRVRGWRPRHVEILPSLRRHLEHVALKEDRIFGARRSLYLLRRALVSELGWKTWPSNCLRHSFKTYHAAFFQDLPKTQLQMGHAGIGMTNYTYGSPATRSNAAAWWAL